MLPRILLACLLAAGLAAVPSPGSAAPAPTPDKVEPALQASLEASGTADFWIRFEARADLGQASQLTDWRQRGAAVVARLRSTAEASQAEVRAMLDAAGQAYRAFYVTNAIYVHDGTPALAEQLAAEPAVAELLAPTAYERIEPRVTEQPAQQLQSLAWGIENIRANQVWDQFGVRGEGITVATIDSGVQYDHPALVNQYRGNLGDGTFDHNYNWFDATGACPDAPCDPEGHGTHVTGTMVGDDGAGNQIGVAPHANWIATNGCCPSDEALVSSGEWLLAPTDLAGENPDPGKRPHIINNSWGTRVPSNDPFMEDVLAAWEAAGIFAVWSNGNNGPGCETSGSPGSRISAYSVGAHNRNNLITGFSSRGPGQDGETKPDITAPGATIRSALPGNRYGTSDGTSMAAPHVAGTVALLWSGAPGLIGEPEATRELLDLSAIDTEDLTCGGTAGDNNVYGEGRLDALGLMQIAPIDNIGRLTGRVTGQAGEPIVGAKVTVRGEVTRVRTIGADAGYTVLLPPGDYQVTVEAFGYATVTDQVQITVDETVTRDFTLATVDRVTVTGRVTDGSGHGWPMYARIRVLDTPVTTYTDPLDGSYRLELPEQSDYHLLVTPQYPDYQRLTVPVAVGGTDLVRDLAVPVDERCTAAGYEFGSDGTFTAFHGATLPRGWSIVDNLDAGEGQVWRFDDPGERGNLTGGDGAFATVDGISQGPAQDTELRTPVLDLSDVAEPVVRFDHSFGRFTFGDQVGRVELSLDAGETWRTLLQIEASVTGREEIPIPEAAGVAGVQVRFHYTNSANGFWWQLDNVLVGSEVTCDPIEGGLVAGHVRDRNTGSGIAGAAVRSDDLTTTSLATPDDPAIDDGFYWLFAPGTGERELAGSAHRYHDHAVTVTVTDSALTHADLPLPAGQLSIDGEIATELQVGSSTEATVTITNTGTAPASLQLRGRGVPVEPPAGAGAAPRRIDAPVTDLSLAAAELPAGAVPPGSTAAPWQEIANYPFPVLDNLADVWDGVVYSVAGIDANRWRNDTVRFDPVTGTWTELAPIPTPREKPNGAIIDGKFYVVGGWDTDGDTPIPTLEIYDIATDTWSTGAPIPTAWAASGSAVVDGKLYLVGGCAASCGSTDVWVYDPATDSWSAAAPYPMTASWTHCGGIDGLLYCAGGSRPVTGNGYVYDPALDEWRSIASMPQPQWGGAYAVANGRLVVSGGVIASQITNQGYAYDPHTDRWEPIPNASQARYRAGAACGFFRIGGSPGGTAPAPDSERLPGFDDCANDLDLGWLSFEPATATLAPGERLTVTASMVATPDTGVTQPGAYAARITVADDTPYVTAPLPVTMDVTPANNWGRITGTVTGVGCDSEPVPLGGATVHIDGRQFDGTVTTDSAGRFEYWSPVQNNRLTLTVTRPDYQPASRSTLVLPMRAVTEDFTLVCAP
ncbi:MAG TPA: S8 family serine peptidase [Natronosporangium sp.]